MDCCSRKACSLDHDSVQWSSGQGAVPWVPVLKRPSQEGSTSHGYRYEEAAAPTSSCFGSLPILLLRKLKSLRRRGNRGGNKIVKLLLPPRALVASRSCCHLHSFSFGCSMRASFNEIRATAISENCCCHHLLLQENLEMMSQCLN